MTLLIGVSISLATLAVLMLVWWALVKISSPVNPLHTRFNNGHIEECYREWNKQKGK